MDQILKDKILHALKDKELYLEPELTLKKFADHIESNTSYVSKTINEGFNQNFNSLINEYRVKAFLSYIHNNQYKTYTIEALYQKAGFKSKSSFQTAFKKIVGVTASHYIKDFKKGNLPKNGETI